VLPQAKPRTTDTAGRVLLIFIDDLHVEAEISPHVRRVMQQIADTLLHEGDLVTVLSSGPSFIEIGPTYDKKAVVEAVSKIRGSGLIPADFMKMLESPQGPADIRARAQIAFYTAYRMLGELEAVSNRRKAVIYVSNGYDFDPFAEGRAGTDKVQGGRFADPMRFTVDQENPYFSLGRISADVALHRLMRELVLSANRANATIYTLDPRGLSSVVDFGATNVDQSEWRTHIQKTTSTLRYMAEETGGFAIVNTNDFVSELKRVDAETSDYYLLGFTSTNPDPKKRTRALEVTVRRPGVTVASRRAYALKTVGELPAPPPLTPVKK
jgi:VWFA-related protein